MSAAGAAASRVCIRLLLLFLLLLVVVVVAADVVPAIAAVSGEPQYCRNVYVKKTSGQTMSIGKQPDLGVILTTSVPKPSAGVMLWCCMDSSITHVM